MRWCENKMRGMWVGFKGVWELSAEREEREYLRVGSGLRSVGGTK